MTTQNTTSSNFSGLVDKAPTCCPYCGKELKRTTVFVGGKEFNPPCFGSCGCSRSREYLDGRDLSPEEKRNQKYKAAGIGTAYLNAQVEESMYLQDILDGKSLFITGGIGSGKTYMASALAMRLIDRGKTVRFETAIGILRGIRDSFNGIPDDTLKRAMNCDVLVLDDLGKEKPTDFALGVLFELIDERYKNSLPIIVTTNYQGGELVERMSDGNSMTGAAIVSRLHETCNAVVLDGTDRRYGNV